MASAPDPYAALMGSSVTWGDDDDDTCSDHDEHHSQEYPSFTEDLVEYYICRASK